MNILVNRNIHLLVNQKALIEPFGQKVPPQQLLSIISQRLSTAEVSVALRPFFFSVHPDLFGQHPEKRQINENSLKQLNMAIEAIQMRRFSRPLFLQFYLRDVRHKGIFRSVTIHINKEININEAIQRILKECQLSTEYIDNIIKKKCKNMSNGTNKLKTSSSLAQNVKNSNDDAESDENLKTSVERQINTARQSFHLFNWLKENCEAAKQREFLNRPLCDEVIKLKSLIKQQLQLADIRLECGWNLSNFRGCLQCFLSLVEQHPEVRDNLKGRIVVFAPFTGISLDGHIMLYSGEVRHNWLELIRNVHKYDRILFRLPGFEKSVSQVLRGIRIGRRKFMPKILAGDYERNLQQITTSLSDYRGTRDYPSQWPKSLEGYEIVVETEAGPLMVSPTGQFIVPSSLPGTLLVNFITSNLQLASEKRKKYELDKHVEQSLYKECVSFFNLLELRKDDNITPELMIECCTKLLKHKQILVVYLKSLKVNISTYYSVLSDGMVCIPWNWKL